MAFWVARPEKDQCGGHQLCSDSPWPRLILGPRSEGGAPLSQELMARKPQSSLCRCSPPSSPQCLQHPQHPSGPSACRCGHPRKRQPLPGAGESQCLPFCKEMYLLGLCRVLSLNTTNRWATELFHLPLSGHATLPFKQANKIWNNYLHNNEAYKTHIP